MSAPEQLITGSNKDTISFFRKKVIGGECSENLGPLLVRYQIINSPWFSIFIHHLLRSDIERDLHDHPWSFVTILLSGGYWEHCYNYRSRFKSDRIRVRRNRWSILFRHAEWKHALELDRPVWTLVFTGRTRRNWGFNTKDGWKWWREYKYSSGDECGGGA